MPGTGGTVPVPGLGAIRGAGTAAARAASSAARGIGTVGGSTGAEVSAGARCRGGWTVVMVCVSPDEMRGVRRMADLPLMSSGATIR
ncbi:hypothetical protein [Actinomycetospora chibensis]|uniref:Uncharacterized protein n=1 Tax=Actinomycetospora chibensis TaxID=663606 RepID=A0ABV9REM0_9PSEU|nr:hypothetical protein [Actinomycetospora chibensis]MDD7924134.1 hypothetical protein [Actinomycetospora chibensis]